MENTPYQDSICARVQVCASLFARQMDQLLAPFDISAAQYKVLDILHHGGQMSAAQLCQRSGMDTGAMTRMLDRLEHKGLIQRQSSPSDRRVPDSSILSSRF